MIITYNSTKYFNPIYFKNHVPKPMLASKILQSIDKNPVNFKYWGCQINCVKSTCHCKNNNPATRYVCYKLYSKVLIFL